MKHYLQYHNPERMRERFDERAPLPFYVLTNKPVGAVPGHRVWLFSGEGQPRRYFLCQTFIASRIEAADHPEFTNKVSGEEGVRFDPAIEVTQEAWFRWLKHRMVNFSLGFRQITDGEIIQILESYINISST